MAAIVEGDGEVSALPELIRRLAYAHGIYDVVVPRPFLLVRPRFLVPAEFARAVEIQAQRVDVGGSGGGVLALLDVDDDCAVALTGEIAASYAGKRPVRIVAAVREYESILLASAGVPDPEAVRGAKERLKAATGAPYRETVHQARLSAALDLERARDCRWFRKLEKEVLAILSG